MKGRISSFQSMGAVDGPGIRSVVFMQGCPLRCVYCHNPETWDINGNEYSVEEVIGRILRFQTYFGEKGGVTVSGGEPLMQPEFVSELFSRLRAEGIHTALDTSGAGPLDGARKILQDTDLVLCDLKFGSDEEYLKYCKGDRKNVLSFLKLTEEMRIPLWIRHVVVPGLTDNREGVVDIAKQAKGFSNLKKIELLPFRKLCMTKYDELGIPYPMAQTKVCPDSVIEALNREIQSVLT